VRGSTERHGKCPQRQEERFAETREEERGNDGIQVAGIQGEGIEWQRGKTENGRRIVGRKETGRRGATR